MRTPIYATAVALIAVATLTSQTGPATPASVPVHDLTLNRMTDGVLATLAERYHVVVGVYGTFTGNDSHTVALSFKDGNLGEVFDAIVRADPRFEWGQTDNGAIHFASRDSPLSLLGVRVHLFEVENPRRGQMSDRLAHIPEVAGWLRDNKCSLIEWIVGMGRTKEWGQFAVHSKDAPLSAVLDEIAAKSGAYFWSVARYSAEPCEISVEFRKN